MNEYNKILTFPEIGLKLNLSKTVSAIKDFGWLTLQISLSLNLNPTFVLLTASQAAAQFILLYTQYVL